MKKSLIILVSIFLFWSCSDEFLNTENRNQLNVESFLSTETDLQTAVNAAYTPLAQNGMFGLEYFKMLDGLDPYIWNENPYYTWDRMSFTPTTFNYNVDCPYDATWSNLYLGVFRTSDVLARMPKLKAEMDSLSYFKYEAQLKALRGMYYFYLVTWFNTPIYYDETNIPTDPSIGQTNGTVEQFWNKLEEDLNFAAKYLPLSWDDNNVGRITKGAAYAQLGKALLYKHYHYYLRFNKSEAETKANLVKAKEAFNAVMNLNQYELIQAKSSTKKDYLAALLSNFSYVTIPAGNNTYAAENNKESVWEVQFNDDNRSATAYSPGAYWGGNQLFQYYASIPSSYRNYEIDPSLWYEFETTTSHAAGFTRDPRAYATCYLDGDTLDWREESPYYNVQFNSSVNTKLTVTTFNLYSGTSPSQAIGLKKYYYPQFIEQGDRINCAPFNIRVIRYADVLLMYAETCYLYDDDSNGSGLVALNKVRERSGMPDIDALTPQSIIHERTVELATEGHYYNDIVRWSFDSDFISDTDLDAIFHHYFVKSKHQYFPIPQEEIDANNGKLKQNPGW